MLWCDTQEDNINTYLAVYVRKITNLRALIIAKIMSACRYHINVL